VLIPLRTKNPPETFPFITFLLMVANIAIYAFTSDLFLVISDRALDSGGLSWDNRDLYRFLSCMFLHADIFHILGNMLFLWIFGCAVEGRLGWWKYTILYLVAGLAGGALHLLLAGPGNPDIPMIGASGAIMGLVGAALWMFPFAPVTFFYLFWWRIGTMDWPLWGAAVWYLGWDLLAVMLFGSGSSGVANLAHLGGAAGGFLMALLYRPKRDDAYVAEAKAMLHESKDLRTLSRTQLAELHRLQPTDHTILLNLFSRAYHDNFSLTPEQLTAFRAALPRMIQESEHDALLPIVLHLSSKAGEIPPRLMQQYALRLEKDGRPQPAYQLYDYIVRDPVATPADWENSLFRMGSIREQWFQDWQGAKSCYELFLERFPMSPMAPQVQQRLKAVAARPAT